MKNNPAPLSRERYLDLIERAAKDTATGAVTLEFALTRILILCSTYKCRLKRSLVKKHILQNESMARDFEAMEVR